MGITRPAKRWAEWRLRRAMRLALNAALLLARVKPKDRAHRAPMRASAPARAGARRVSWRGRAPSVEPIGARTDRTQRRRRARLAPGQVQRAVGPWGWRNNNRACVALLRSVQLRSRLVQSADRLLSVAARRRAHWQDRCVWDSFRLRPGRWLIERCRRAIGWQRQPPRFSCAAS